MENEREQKKKTHKKQNKNRDKTSPCARHAEAEAKGDAVADSASAVKSPSHHHGLSPASESGGAKQQQRCCTVVLPSFHTKTGPAGAPHRYGMVPRYTQTIHNTQCTTQYYIMDVCLSGNAKKAEKRSALHTLDSNPTRWWEQNSEWVSCRNSEDALITACESPHYGTRNNPQCSLRTTIQRCRAVPSTESAHEIITPANSKVPSIASCTARRHLGTSNRAKSQAGVFHHGTHVPLVSDDA